MYRSRKRKEHIVFFNPFPWLRMKEDEKREAGE